MNWWNVFLTIYVVMVVYEDNIVAQFPYYCRQTFVTNAIIIASLILGTGKYMLIALGTSRDHVGLEQRRPFLSNTFYSL